MTSVIHFAAYAYVGESVGQSAQVFPQQRGQHAEPPRRDGRQRCARHRVLVDLRHLRRADPCRSPKITCRSPVNPYGESKLMVEKILEVVRKAPTTFRYAALRYFNAAGADPDGEIGEDHDPETHLIPLAIEAALGRGRELQIFGTDYPTPDGTAVRDYIHVVDLAEAHLLALENLTRGTPSIKVNLGTGQGHSVREVLETVEKVTGRKVPAREVGRRAGDPPELVADPRRAAELLEWKPKYAALETIIEHAYRWHERRAQGV